MIFKTIRPDQRREEQSSRDSTLLTVGFNLRTKNAPYSPQSPAGKAQSTNSEEFVSSLRDLDDGLFCTFRRLKPTVNKVLSLQDTFCRRYNSVTSCKFFISKTMKKIIILFLSTVLFTCCGNKQHPATTPQTSGADVAAAVDHLMKVMVNADENTLNSITADELVYGHSKGNVQNKSEFIAEVLSGNPSRFVSIELSDQTIQIAGNTAVVRHILTAETISIDDESGSLRIGVMQVWQLQNGMWKLLARQAYRL